MKKVCYALFIFLFSFSAHAKFYVWTEGMLDLSGDSPEDTTQSNSSSTFGYEYQLHVAYMTGNNFYFGAIASGNSSSTTTTSYYDNSEYEYNVSQTFLGPSLGYFAQNGFFILGSYFLSASEENGNETSSTISEGTGWQAQIGMIAKFGGVRVTFSLVYRNHKMDTSGGYPITNPITYSTTHPYIGVLFKF